MADEILVLLIHHDGNDSPAVALARNRAELLEQVKIAVWGEPHPADTTNDAGDDMAEGMTDTLLETGVMRFEGDPPLRLVRIPVKWGASPFSISALRWLLNITTEYDRKDVRTRQAARLLDEFSGADGRTNRELLEAMWAHVSGVTVPRSQVLPPADTDGGS